MQRLVDPSLFPQDQIADYYQAIAPIGFHQFYRLMAHLGIEPLLLAKILPLLLALIMTGYSFRVCQRLTSSPAAAFLGTLFLNQAIWLKDDVVSASPRAFLYPIFAAFLYYLLRRSLLPCLFTILLQGIFFPQMALVHLALLTVRLVEWRNSRPHWTKQRFNWVLWGLGVGLGLGVILLFSTDLQDLGPTFTVPQMKQMIEFATQGRTRYFGVSPVEFWLGGASGLRPPLLPVAIWLSVALPFWWKRSAIAPILTPEIKLLPEILVASLGLFGLAHVLFPRLYFPNRYTYHSLRFVMAIAAGIILWYLLKTFWQWILTQKRLPWLTRRISVVRWENTTKPNPQNPTATPTKNPRRFRESGWLGLWSSLIIATFLVPALPPLLFLCQAWHVGQAPAIYEFLAAQPKDILIASLDDEADNLPAFTQRSVLVSGEFAFAFHVRYYSEMKQRTQNLLQAHYSPDLSVVQSFNQQYGIDFWLINQDFLQPDYLLSKSWLVNSSLQSEVLQIANQLEGGNRGAIAPFITQCTVAQTETLSLLDVQCLQAP
jgi:hypothetical protein